MQIAFYECKNEEKAFFEAHLTSHTLFFFEGTVQESLTQSEAYEIISVFVHSHMSDDILEKLPKLRYVQTRSTGYDHLKCPQLYERKITVSNVAGYAGPAVAEFAFSLLLNATRKTYIALQRNKEGNDDYLDLKGVELYGKTMGIVGLGTIGLHMASIAKGFGMHILGYSRTQKPEYKTLGIHFVALEEVLKNADFLMLAVPLTPKTVKLINTENSQLLKASCIIVNIARKDIMQSSLYHTLPNTIACDIDSDTSLMGKNNILHTPHMAYYTAEALQRILQISLENMEQFIQGEVPQNCLKLACKEEHGIDV